MIFITYTLFIILTVICVGLQYITLKNKTELSFGNNPQFLQFQWTYFASYFPAVLADWLQGPYLYKLYSHYGFEEDQIAVIYVVGFASTVFLGTWAPIAADRYGRKKLCVLFTILYTLSCFLKLSRYYGILLISRILSGVATSLLFSAFEAWYVYEHLESHDFPKEWIDVTFSKAALGSGVLAIIAGILANVFAEWFHLGPVSPFMLAIPCLIITGGFVSSQWKENRSSQQSATLRKSLAGGLKVIVTEPKVFLVGAIQSLFESVMYIIVFIWTPVLDPIVRQTSEASKTTAPSLGIVFASFMVCIMIGSAVYQLGIQSRSITVPQILAFAIALAVLSNILCVLATHPDAVSKNVALIAFLGFQVAVGIYFPAISHISGKLVPQEHRRSITNMFRVPLNLIACVVLMMLHNASFRHGNRLIFVTCTGLLILAGLLVGKLVVMTKDDEEVIKVTYSNNGTVLVAEDTA